MNKYLTIKEVANELEYSYKAIYKAVKQGAIPSIRISKSRVRIPSKWLSDVLAKYADFQAYQDAKLGITSTPEPKPAVGPKPEPESKPAIQSIEVDMPKKKPVAEPEHTEIKTNKPKPKPFIPNPKKRLKKLSSENVKEPELEPEEMPEPQDEDEGIDILSGYKGIGNYE